jgi:hypothetical protein
MVEKLFYSYFTFFLYVYLHFHVFLTTVQSIFKNSWEVYPIEAYLMGKGAVEVSGCSPCSALLLVFFVSKGVTL